MELGGDNDEGRRSGCDSRLTDEDRLSDCGGGSEATPEKTGRAGRPRWKRTGSAIKSRLSRSKSSILRRSQLLVQPLRRAWRNSQDIEDHDSSDQDVSLAPAGGNAGDVSSVARSCMDLRGNCKGGDSAVTTLAPRPHMRSTADLFRFTTV